MLLLQHVEDGLAKGADALTASTLPEGWNTKCLQHVLDDHSAVWSFALHLVPDLLNQLEGKQPIPSTTALLEDFHS